MADSQRAQLHSPGDKDGFGDCQAGRAVARSHWPGASPIAAKVRTWRAQMRPTPAVVPAGRDEGVTARLLRHHVSPELFSLWLFEALVCGLLGYLLLSAAVPEAGAGQVLRLRAASQAIGLALAFGLLSFTVGLYSPDLCLETRRLAIGTVLTGILAVAAISIVGPVAGRSLPGQNGLLPVVMLVCWCLLVFVLRLAFSAAMRMNLLVRRVLVVGADQIADGCGDAGAARIVAALQSMRRGRFEVVAVLPARDAAKLTPERLKAQKIWGIIITAGARTSLAPRHFEAWRGYRLYGDTAFWESRLRRVDIDQPGTAWPSHAAAAVPGCLEAVLTRAGDVLLSLVLLVAAAPLMAATAVLIKLDSPGPILYRQERVGLHDGVFTLLKFRSMHVDAEARGPVWATQRDPRVTRVGAFIRLMRIDELPQMWNILRGEMSFIGPRPERQHFVEQLTRLVPRYCERCLVKPGLTGWAQVNYPYGASVEDGRAKLSYDLYYVKYRSLLLYIVILFLTVQVILFQKGAR